MSSISSTFLVALFALAVAAAAVVQPDPHPAGYSEALPAPTCFKKLTKCCFKWAPCGAKTKNVPVETRCDLKRCKDVCKVSCKLVPHKHPLQACAFDKVGKGETCGKFLSYGPHHKPVVTDKCFPVFGFKKHCYDAFGVVHKKICKNVCAHVCELEKAVCSKTDVYHFVKLCPKLACGAMRFEGPTVAPADFVGKEKKLLRTIPGQKEILGETPIDSASARAPAPADHGAHGVHAVPAAPAAPAAPAVPAAPAAPAGPAEAGAVSYAH